jgi:phospholipase/carboxylesterase
MRQAIAHHMDTLPVSVTYREFSSAHEIRPSELAPRWPGWRV